MSAASAIGIVGLLAAAALAKRGSSARGGDFVTTLSGDELFGHVTRPEAARSILRQGFRAGSGRFGAGVYLLPPDEPWGDGMPPGSTPAHQFRLLRHPDIELRVLRVRLPPGSRLLRVTPPNVTMQAFTLLEGRAAYTDALGQRPPWEDSDVSRDAILKDLLARHQIDGLYIYDFVFDADEVLVLDPRKIEVVREQMHRGAR